MDRSGTPAGGLRDGAGSHPSALVLDRRRFLAAGAWLGAAALLPGCDVLPGPTDAARLTARPDELLAGTTAAPGTRPLGLTGTRDVLLHVPPGLATDRAAPLVVTLHGAGGDAEAGLALLRGQADERGLLLLAPASRGSTWDAVGGRFGPDVVLVDRALATVFAAVRVDPERIAISGFSDGASYALGLGLANGTLFRRVVAFSPGFVPDAPADGRPAVFVAHGDADEVLPIDRTSRRIVPRLREDGYEVTYQEFAGPHTVPPDVARTAVDWLDWAAG
ncbi:alpha/beta hydrolase [Modestobacter sp. I12A-02662]|uniref:alpha/beta hydrolase n=1 Tax=Modestobacter sp. I12A-02662 TaxID=1730496 RepID=UPI0034DFECE6